MKKTILFASALMLMSSFIACGDKKSATEENVATVDSVEVVQDSVVEDTIIADTVVVDTIEVAE